MITDGGTEMGMYVTKVLKEPDFPNQRGSTCGLYALEGVIHALYPKTMYRATKDKNNPKSTNWISLRNIAKKKLGITVIGEIFNVEHLSSHKD